MGDSSVLGGGATTRIGGTTRVAMRSSALLSVAVLAALAVPAEAQIFWPGQRDDSMNRVERKRTRAVRSQPYKVVEAPKDLAKPEGPIVIAISIEKQQLKLYDINGVFAESPVSTGTATHPTPMGVFSIIGKAKFHRSNIYSGAPMPHMQRITWSGVAMHAGVLPGYPASHGCIRLPAAFAARLFNWTRMGARVIVTPGEISPAEFSHPRLLAKRIELPDPNVPVAVAATDAAKEATKDAVKEIADLRLTSASAKSDEPRKADEVRTADASGALPAKTDTNDADKAAVTVPQSPPPLPGTAEFVGPVKPRTGQIAAYVSAKEKKLFVRQNFEPLFDVPVTIAPGDRPLGTHVFTARTEKGDDTKLQWSVVSLPAPPPRAPKRADLDPRRKGKKVVAAVATPERPAPSTAAEALERVTIPDDAMKRIAMAMAPGASLTISDHGLGDETGKGTDFIVPLRDPAGYR